MTLTLPKTCSMGGVTGLVGTIGVTLLNPDGTTHTARTAAGIYEIGGGYYGKQIIFPDNWLGIIDWDDAGAPVTHAVDEYIYYENNPVVDRILTATEIRQVSVNDASATTKQFITTLTETKSTFWERAAIRFTSGQNEGIIRAIHTYNGTTKQVGLKTGLPYAPANGDTFIIAMGRKFLIPDIDEINATLKRHDNKITGLISMDDDLDLSPETWLMFNTDNELIGIRKFGTNRSQFDLEVKDAAVTDRTVDDTKTIKYSGWIKSWEPGV